MAEREFALPKVIGNGTAGFPAGNIVNVPPGKSVACLADLERAIADEAATIDLRRATRAEEPIAAIRTRLCVLTYREMDGLVAEIFAAHERLHPATEPTVVKPAITAQQMAKVLDCFAHGD